jgi:hypothetical protein
MALLFNLFSFTKFSEVVKTLVVLQKKETTEDWYIFANVFDEFIYMLVDTPSDNAGKVSF